MPGFLKAATTVFVGGAIVGAGALAVLPSMPQSALALPPLFAGVRVADLPPASCKQQLWPNTDRSCQSWTIANPTVQALLSAPARTPSSQPSSPSSPSSSTVTVIERTEKVASRRATLPAVAELTDAGEQTASVAHQDVAATSVAPEPAVASASAAPAIIERLTVGETAAEALARAARAPRAPEEKPRIGRNTRNTDIVAPIPIASRTADGTKRVIMIRPTSRQDALYYSARRELAANALLSR
jgi:hypothetical protein